MKEGARIETKKGRQGRAWRAALALALYAAMTVHASACHRFHVWRYPWPQRCDAARFEVAVRRAAPPFTPEPPSAKPDKTLPKEMPLNLLVVPMGAYTQLRQLAAHRLPDVGDDAVPLGRASAISLDYLPLH